MSCGGAISLEAAVRTCDVNVGEATRIQSDRFQNPYNMVCVPWDGLNSKGQEVCPDSFWTKTPGCDSAEDRVEVENAQRPQYINYVTLGAQGIAGHIYGNASAYSESVQRDKFDASRNQLTGNFGKQWTANVDYTGCSVGAYERSMAQMNQQMRAQAAMQNGYNAASNRAHGGY
jgi:hypothetical protein